MVLLYMWQVTVPLWPFMLVSTELATEAGIARSNTNHGVWVYRGRFWFRFEWSALLLAVVLCWVGRCFTSWLLVCLLRIALTKYQTTISITIRCSWAVHKRMTAPAQRLCPARGNTHFGSGRSRCGQAATRSAICSLRLGAVGFYAETVCSSRWLPAGLTVSWHGHPCITRCPCASFRCQLS